MARLILDTSVVIAAERDDARLGPLVQPDDDIAIAAITVAELLVGVERADRRHRGRRSQFVEHLMTSLVIEDYTLLVARHHARLIAVSQATGRPRGSHDLIVAATALATGRELLTLDGRAFTDLPGVVIRSSSPPSRHASDS